MGPSERIARWLSALWRTPILALAGSAAGFAPLDPIPVQRVARERLQGTGGARRVPPLTVAQRMRHAEDLRFVRAVLAGDRPARERLTDRLACVPGILRAKARRIGLFLSEGDLEELTQRAAVAIWTKLQYFEGQSSLETWAFGFCVNELYKWRERRERGPGLVPLDSLEQEPAAAPAEVEGDLEALARALASLPAESASILELKHFDELTFEEIGALLGISPNTAKTRYYRGLGRLRELLIPARGVET